MEDVRKIEKIKYRKNKYPIYLSNMHLSSKMKKERKTEKDVSFSTSNI